MSVHRRTRPAVRGAAAGTIRPRRHSPQPTAQITATTGSCRLHEALNSVGVGMSQQTAADHLNTTTDGTAWSGGETSPSGYPVPDVLNHHETRNYYVPQSVSSDGSSAVDQYEQDLTTTSMRSALRQSATYEIPGGAHLNGHPKDRQIFHWFDIRGYANSGGSTMYEDSVHDANSVPWYAGVPAYSALSSSKIVTIVEGRATSVGMPWRSPSGSRSCPGSGSRSDGVRRRGHARGGVRPGPELRRLVSGSLDRSLAPCALAPHRPALAHDLARALLTRA